MDYSSSGLSMEQRALAKGININAIAQQVRTAVKKGDVVRPSTCSQCGSPRYIEGHHRDYAFAFEVTWLCSSCHKRLHRSGFVTLFDGEPI